MRFWCINLQTFPQLGVNIAFVDTRKVGRICKKSYMSELQLQKNLLRIYAQFDIYRSLLSAL